jgi:hypothetical protein
MTHFFDFFSAGVTHTCLNFNSSAYTATEQNPVRKLGEKYFIRFLSHSKKATTCCDEKTVNHTTQSQSVIHVAHPQSLTLNPLSRMFSHFDRFYEVDASGLLCSTSGIILLLLWSFLPSGIT